MVSPTDICENEGVFTLALTAGSTWTLSQQAAAGCTLNSSSVYNGDFVVAGDQVTFHQVQSDCGGSFVYSWQLVGASIAFARVRDSCTPRIVIFTAHPWNP